MSELQGVVLCGGSGSRMTELTDHLPKCLLPVAGIPMFWYPLNSLSKTGVKDVKLFTNEQYRNEYEKLLSEPFFQWEHMKVEVLTIPRDHDEWGTADVLRHFHAKLTRDILLVSGDFVGDITLSPLVDLFRCRDASFCMLISENCVNGNIPGPKVKRSKGRDLLGWNEQSQRVVYCAAEEDFENAISADSWMKKFNNISLTAKYNDCHVYIVKNWALQILNKHKKFSSFKADFLPYLLEQQYALDGDCSPHSSDPLCLAYVQPLENGTTVAHANNLGAYFEVNKAILKSLARVSPRLTMGKQFDFKATGISSTESRVAESAKISERVVVKRSVVGDNVSIGEKSRVQGSVIMDNVEIGKGSNVTMSIICPGAKIMDGVEIMNSIVTNNQTVQPNTKIQNEVVEAESDNEDWHNE